MSVAVDAFFKIGTGKSESLGIRLCIIHCGQQNNGGCALKIIKFSDYAFMNSAPTNAEQLDPKSSWVTVSQKDSESVKSFLVYQNFLGVGKLDMRVNFA